MKNRIKTYLLTICILLLSCGIVVFAFYEEKQEDFLRNEVVIGSYDEAWSLRKVLRRFLWHDRIHGKAMYRRSIVIFGSEAIVDVFSFGTDGTNDNL